MAVVCPRCGAATAFAPKMIDSDRAVLLEQSSGDRIITGRARVPAITRSESPDHVRYAICVCQNCSCGYVVMGTLHDPDNHWSVVYPLPRRAVAEEIRPIVSDEFNEVELCYAVGALRACVAMCQRVLESLCQDKGVPGLNELLENGYISKALFNRATQIRLWAGLTKHKPIAEPVTREDADQLVGYLRAILEHVYVEPARLDALEQKRKELDKK